MSYPICNVTYIGTALPLGATTEVLFDSTLNKVPVVLLGIHRFVANIDHDEDGTIKGYWQVEGSTAWTQFYDSGLITAPAAGAITTKDVVIEGYHHVKFEWLNGGTNQTTFTTTLSLIDDRAAT